MLIIKKMPIYQITINEPGAKLRQQMQCCVKGLNISFSQKVKSIWAEGKKGLFSPIVSCKELLKFVWLFMDLWEQICCLFYIDNILDNLPISIFDIDKFVDNLKSANISAFDNFCPIYR